MGDTHIKNNDLTPSGRKREIIWGRLLHYHKCLIAGPGVPTCPHGVLQVSRIPISKEFKITAVIVLS